MLAVKVYDATGVFVENQKWEREIEKPAPVVVVKEVEPKQDTVQAAKKKKDKSFYVLYYPSLASPFGLKLSSISSPCSAA